MLRRWLTRLARSISTEPWLWGLIGLALLLRLPAVGYGLPLMLVNDEPPFTLAALKMLELRTLVPAASPDAFASILYYPPYLSYLLLPFFAAIAGAAYLAEGEVQLAARLAADLSPFFVAARLVSVGVGLASVYLAYRIAERLFASRKAAAASAFLLSTSLLHLSLSVVSRQWIVLAFVLLLALYVLTEEGMLEARRYLRVMLVAGVGMGFSAVAALALPMAGLYWLLFGTLRIPELIRDKRLWAGALAFVALAALPSLLHPGSSGFLVDVTARDSKSLAELVSSPWNAFSETLYSEPVLALLAALGAGLLAFARPRLIAFFALWMLLYAFVFYAVFRFEPRFMLPLVGIYALIGGYAVTRMGKRPLGALAACLLLVAPLAASARLASLAYADDTRAEARAFVLKELSPDDKVIVYAPATRVPTTAAAIAELEAIDPSALRAADRAQRELGRTGLPHALNLTNAENAAFFASLSSYAATHGYAYLLLDPAYAAEARGHADVFARLTEDAAVLAAWRGLGPDAALDVSAFPASFLRVFSGRHLGPDVVLYRID